MDWNWTRKIISNTQELTCTAVVKSKIRHKPQDETVKGVEKDWGWAIKLSWQQFEWKGHQKGSEQCIIPVWRVLLNIKNWKSKQLRVKRRSHWHIVPTFSISISPVGWGVFICKNNKSHREWCHRLPAICWCRVIGHVSLGLTITPKALLMLKHVRWQMENIPGGLGDKWRIGWRSSIKWASRNEHNFVRWRTHNIAQTPALGLSIATPIRSLSPRH